MATIREYVIALSYAVDQAKQNQFIQSAKQTTQAVTQEAAKQTEATKKSALDLIFDVADGHGRDAAHARNHGGGVVLLEDETGVGEQLAVAGRLLALGCNKWSRDLLRPNKASTRAEPRPRPAREWPALVIRCQESPRLRKAPEAPLCLPS